MAITTSCPACGSKSRVSEEHLGRRVKCPQCGGKYTVPEVLTDDADEEIEDEEAAEEEPAPRSRKGAPAKSGGVPGWVWAAGVGGLLVIGVAVWAAIQFMGAPETGPLKKNGTPNAANNAGGGPATGGPAAGGPGPAIGAPGNPAPVAVAGADGEMTYQGKTSREWLKQLHDLDYNYRVAAAYALAAIKDAAAIQGLAAEAAKKNIMALNALTLIGPEAKEALPTLEKLRKEAVEPPQNELVWTNTVSAIARILDKVPRDDDPHREAKLLLVLKNDTDNDMRLWAVLALYRLDPRTGTVSDAVLSALETAKKDKDKRVAAKAADFHKAMEPFRARKLSPAEVEAQKDYGRLQGVWEVVSVERDGKKLPDKDVKGASFVVTADRYTFTLGEEKVEGFFRLDAAKELRAIDATRTAGADKGKVLLGVYQIDGTNLKFCYNKPGKETRPTDFTSKPDSGFSLYVLRRKA